MKKFKITKRDMTFLAIGSIAMMVLAWLFNRKDSSSPGKSPDEESSVKY